MTAEKPVAELAPDDQGGSSRPVLSRPISLGTVSVGTRSAETVSSVIPSAGIPSSGVPSAVIPSSGAGSSRKAPRNLAAVAVMATLGLGLAGCSAATDTAGTGSTVEKTESAPNAPAADANIPAGFEAFYEQPVDWRACEAQEVVSPSMAAPDDLEAYECATLVAPMDWEDPGGPEIELGLARYAPGRDGTNRDPLFYNLGGPGGGAVDSLSSVVRNVFTDKVVRNFQVIALDPRGVGASTPIQCLTDAERNEEEYREEDIDDLSPEELVAWHEDEMRTFGQKCLDRSGELLGYVDSNSVARDFDMARAALGFSSIDYVGYSYGTLIGAIYAELFPERVGRFVLDGVLDPAMNVNEVSEAQLQGMEESLYNWLEFCQREQECPFPGELEEQKQQVTQFFGDLIDQPIETADPDRPLNENLAYTALIGSLYSTETYPILKDAITQAQGGDGSMMLFLADFFNDREPDGTYSTNSDDAFMVINALDYQPVGTPEEWAEAAERLHEAYPLLGEGFGYGSAGLGVWPVESTTPRVPIQAKDAPEMLLVATTHDPATPYVMAENVHAAIKNSVLLTVEGWDHTAYSRSASKCVQHAVDDFLIDGVLPADGTVCD